MIFCAGLFLVPAWPAFAHHDSVGGGGSIGGILPILIGGALLMVGLWIWDRKKPGKKRRKRGKRRH